MKEKKWRHLREISSSKLQRTITATVGSRSINRALGTCFPAPVSQTKVFKASTVVSLSRNQNKDTINFFAKPKKEPSNPQRIEKFCTKVNQTNGFHCVFFSFSWGLSSQKEKENSAGESVFSPNVVGAMGDRCFYPAFFLQIEASFQPRCTVKVFHVPGRSSYKSEKNAKIRF